MNPPESPDYRFWMWAGWPLERIRHFCQPPYAAETTHHYRTTWLHLASDSGAIQAASALNWQSVKPFAAVYRPTTDEVPAAAAYHGLTRACRRGRRWSGVAAGPLLPRVRVIRVRRRARGSRLAAAGTSQPGVAHR